MKKCLLRAHGIKSLASDGVRMGFDPRASEQYPAGERRPCPGLSWWVNTAPARSCTPIYWEKLVKHDIRGFRVIFDAPARTCNTATGPNFESGDAALSFWHYYNILYSFFEADFFSRFFFDSGWSKTWNLTCQFNEFQARPTQKMSQNSFLTSQSRKKHEKNGLRRNYK